MANNDISNLNTKIRILDTFHDFFKSRMDMSDKFSTVFGNKVEPGDVLDNVKTAVLENVKKIVKLKITNHIEPNLKKSVQDSDLVIICTPLGTYKNIVSVIKNNLKNTCILTDVGSAKIFVTNTVNKLINKNTIWIPAHPVAGTEQSGPEAGFADLFAAPGICLVEWPEKAGGTLPVFDLFIALKARQAECERDIDITAHSPAGQSIVLKLES